MTQVWKKIRPFTFALIPVGFLAMVATMLLVGTETGGPAASPENRIETDPLNASASPVEIERVVDPDGKAEPFVPTPSGPEYSDNKVIFEE